MMSEVWIEDEVDTGSPAFTWNYRRAKMIDEDGEVYYGIVEVYYDGGRMIGWTDEPQIAYGEDEEELDSDFAFQKEAFDKPVLDLSKIEKMIPNRGGEVG